MEPVQRKQKKKKDKKPLYILAGFLVFFGVFIYLITRPSNQSKAIKEIETCFNKKDVEMVWYKYKADLYQDEDFLLETRKKLSSLTLTEEERHYMVEHYDDCLCAKCMIEVKSEFHNKKLSVQILKLLRR